MPASAGMSVADNIAFREVRPRTVCQRRLVAQPRRVSRSDAEKKIGLYKIKTRTPGHADLGVIRRQRAAHRAGRAKLGGEVEVLIAANPCFGLDFAAVAQIHAEIMAARNRGAAVLLVSEDLDELLELSDRLVVMFHGQLVYEAPRQAKPT